MDCPKYRYIFTYEYLSGGWSFYGIYADDLESAQREFEKVPDGLYFIKSIDRVDNRHTIKDKDFEPEQRIFSAVK